MPTSVDREQTGAFKAWVSSQILPILMGSSVRAEISWGQLELLIIDWADRQCHKSLHSGSVDCFADVSELYKNFQQHWKVNEVNFLDAYKKVINFELSVEQRELLPLCLFELLLDELTGAEDRLQAKMVRPFDRQRIRSNAYELAYYLFNLRQRMNGDSPIGDQPRLTHMLKVHSQPRFRPRRNVNFHQAIGNYLNRIKHRDLVYPEEWKDIQTPQGQAWLLEVWGNFLNRVGIKDVAPFQLKCFETLLDSALLADGNPDPVMITAGTGFGKTEAFLFPILFYSTINLIRQERRNYGPDALLLYPRIDLCNNQLERYVDYAYHLKESVKASTFTEQIVGYHNKNMFRAALGHSGAKADSPDPFKVECPICKANNQQGEIRLRQPDGAYNVEPFCTECEENHPVKECLLPSLSQWNTGKFTVSISTIDTLHNRLMDLHGRGTLWKKSTHLPRFIVLDEVHIYEGQAGSHVSNLARRLKVYLKNIKDRNGNVTENKTPPIFCRS